MTAEGRHTASPSACMVVRAGNQFNVAYATKAAANQLRADMKGRSDREGFAFNLVKTERHLVMLFDFHSNLRDCLGAGERDNV